MMLPTNLDNHDGPAHAVLLTRFRGLQQADFFKQLLDSRDIPSWVGGANTAAVWGGTQTISGFFVLPEDYDRALALLEEFLSPEGGDALEDREDMEPELEAMTPENVQWVEMAKFESVHEADVFVGALKSRGIPSAMDHHRGRRFEAGWAMVSVPRQYQEEAVQFLEACQNGQGADLYDAPSEEADEAATAAELPAVTCPNCGSANVAGKMPPMDGLAGLVFGAFLLVWNVFLFVMGVIFTDMKRNDHYCRDCGWSW